MSPLPRGFRHSQWDDELADIFEDTFGASAWHDDFLINVFHTGYVDESVSTSDRRLAQLMVDEWASEQYHIDFTDEFDWQRFIEWKSPPRGK